MSSTRMLYSRPEGGTQFETGYFRFGCANQASDRHISFRIRYQVYCVERGFLAKDDYPQKLESDEFDAYSLHLLATHRSGQPAGTVRLVMPSPLGFPLMHHCVFSGDYAFLNDPSHQALESYAEISRLAISKTFRRRDDDTPYGGLPRHDYGRVDAADVLPESPPRYSPEILIGLCRLIYQETKRQGISHWMLAMERSLYLMLKRMGFRYVPAGPEIDYFGPVRPYVLKVEAFEAELFARYPETLRYLAQGLESELVPACLGPVETGSPVCARADPVHLSLAESR